MNISTLLSLLIIAINIGVIALGFLIGYKRGAGRSIVRLVYILLVSVLAYVLAIVIAKPVSVGVLSIIQSYYNDTIQQIADNSTMFEPLIQGLLITIIGPLFLPLLFIIFQALSMIKFKPISDKLVMLVKKDGDPMNKASRFIGAGVGVLQGFLIASALILPLSIASIAVEALDDDITQDNTQNYTAAAATYNSSLNLHIINNLSFMSPNNGVGHFAGTNIFPSLYLNMPIISARVSGVEVNITDAAGAIAGAAGKVADGLNDTSNDTGKIVDIVAKIIPYINQSSYLSELAADVLNTAADIWATGESFLGISFDTENAATSQILESFTQSLQSVDSDSVGDVLEMLFIAGDSNDDAPMASLLSINFDEGVSGSNDDMMNALADVLVAMKSNDNTENVTQTMGAVGSEFIKEYGIPTIPAEKTDAYQEIQSELESAISSMNDLNDYDLSVNALAEKIVSTAKSYGYDVSYGEARLLAISLLEYFGDADNITIDGLKEFFGVSDNGIIAP